jgi:FtsH-binding integral membrane protein
MALQYLMFEWGIAEAIAQIVYDTNWLIILGGFMVVSWLANNLGHSGGSRGRQLAGYGVLIAANALLFAAPLFIANEMAATGDGPSVIFQAAMLSILAFAGLSFIALTTGKDFSFLRGILMWGGILVLALIVGSVLFGVTLGLWFSVAMIGFAGAAILYSTQTVYRSYPPDMEVAAAMSLFSSLALLFWYVLQFLMRR